MKDTYYKRLSSEIYLINPFPLVDKLSHSTEWIESTCMCMPLPYSLSYHDQIFPVTCLGGFLEKGKDVGKVFNSGKR